MQQLHFLHYTFRFYNYTNCDQLHVKICPGQNDTVYQLATLPFEHYTDHVTLRRIFLQKTRTYNPIQFTRTITATSTYK